MSETRGSPTENAAGGRGRRLLVDWGLPVIVGLVLGFGILKVWEALKSPCRKILEQWVWVTISGSGSSVPTSRVYFDFRALCSLCLKPRVAARSSI